MALFLRPQAHMSVPTAPNKPILPIADMKKERVMNKTSKCVCVTPVSPANLHLCAHHLVRSSPANTHLCAHPRVCSSPALITCQHPLVHSSTCALITLCTHHLRYSPANTNLCAHPRVCVSLLSPANFHLCTHHLVRSSPCVLITCAIHLPTPTCALTHVCA
eukprot:1127458-Pelagomonas_calceolata.AAC.2